eukprot:8515423-Prorocentrum_lima.AAC.1
MARVGPKLDKKKKELEERLGDVKKWRKCSPAADQASSLADQASLASYQVTQVQKCFAMTELASLASDQ